MARGPVIPEKTKETRAMARGSSLYRSGYQAGFKIGFERATKLVREALIKGSSVDNRELELL